MTAPSRLSQRALLGLIHTYQHLRAGRLSPCRFVPSCSEYAAQAVVAKGPLRGTALAIWRVLRCNPLGGRGYDPVPFGQS
jgi:putative membrane protein insertion efficiency factor